jgi:Leucine-rich repeat (LRR) protein
MTIVDSNSNSQIDEIYDSYYHGYCLQTKLSESTWQTKVLGDYPRYSGEILQLKVINEMKNSDLLNLKTLHLYKKSIEASDVENSKLIEELHLYCDEISSFELRNLKRLFIHKNVNSKTKLRDDLFDKCVNLEEVYFYNVEIIPKLNALSLDKVEKLVFEKCLNIDFEALNMFQSLSSLSIIECKIEKIEILRLENLKELNLSDNRLSDFDEKVIFECTNLKNLILKENIINEFQFNNTNHKFDFIDLSRNLLKRVPLISNVKKLDISFNELICFTLPNSDKIEEIIFDNNSILVKPESIKSNSLKTLSFILNKLCFESIDELLPNEAKGLLNYKLENLDILKAVFKRSCELNCSGDIFELKACTEYPKEIFLCNSSNSKQRKALIEEYNVVKVTGTARKSNFELLANSDKENVYNDDYRFACSSCGNAVDLLNKTKLYIHADSFDKFKNLKELRFTNVNFDSKVFSKLNLANLRYLDVKNCLNIKDGLVLESKNLPKLKKLSLVNNEIKIIKKLSLNEVEELILDRNGIESIEMIECINLRKLCLSNNNLKIIGKCEMANLESINLDYNQIEEIDEHTFDGCIKLRSISLKYNKLSKMFKIESTSIVSIYIIGNDIIEVAENMKNIVTKQN